MHLVDNFHLEARMQQVEKRVGLECFIIRLGSRLLTEMSFTVDF